MKPAEAPFLRSIRLEPDPERRAAFPFSIPSLAALKEMTFQAGITFFAGGNGTGKSTALEMIAIATGRIVIGDGTPMTGVTPDLVEDLANGDELGLVWKKQTSRGFLLRAEDFLTYKRQVAAQIGELEHARKDFDERMTGYGRYLAMEMASGQRAQLTRRYGDEPDAMSHGESFLQFFRARFTGPGLYLLDEPDTALSTQSVLALMAAIGDMIGQGAQFIVATHNPVLLAFPGARVFDFDQIPVAETSWEELEQVRLQKDFMAHPDIYLRHLGV